MSFGNFHRVHINSILEPTLRLTDLDVITAHLALAHLAILGKSPVFETVTPYPLSGLGMLKLIPELHGDFVIAKCEKFLAKAIFFLNLPFASQELNYGFGSAEEVVSVAPDAVWSVSLRGVVSMKTRERILKRVEGCQAIEHNKIEKGVCEAQNMKALAHMIYLCNVFRVSTGFDQHLRTPNHNRRSH